MRTGAVSRLTTLVLVRYRFDLFHRSGEATRQLLAEDAGVLAFGGDPSQPEWLTPADAEALLEATPSANVSAQQAQGFVARVIEAAGAWRPALDQDARRRAEALVQSHRRARATSRTAGPDTRVEPQLPPDVLGVYVLLPGLPRAPGGPPEAPRHAQPTPAPARYAQPTPAPAAPQEPPGTPQPVGEPPRHAR